MTSVAEREALERRVLLQEEELAKLRAEVAAWRARMATMPVRRDSDFTSISGRATEPVYTPVDAPAMEPLPTL